MNFPKTISNDDINKLPLFQFKGAIVVIETAKDALTAVEALKFEPVLGFDTETRAAFKVGEKYDVALLQLATDTQAYLFRLNKFQMMPELTAILEDSKIIKAGVALRDDIKGLQKILPFEGQSFVELANLAKENKIEKFGLRALTAILLKKRLSKKAKVSNWELKNLSREQVHYAACDAVVGYQIYQALNPESQNS
jgi:ribonuclease D